MRLVVDLAIAMNVRSIEEAQAIVAELTVAGVFEKLDPDPLEVDVIGWRLEGGKQPFDELS